MSQVNEKQKNNAVKAGIWYTISSITVKAITILTTPIFTRMMSTADYGLATTFTSWYTLLLVFSSLNLTYSIGRAKLDFPNKLDEYVGSMQLLSAAVTAVLGVIGIVFINPIAEFMELNPNLVLLLIVYLFFAPSISFTQSKFRYQYKYKGNIGITAYITVSSVLVTLLLMCIFKSERYYAKVLGSVIPAVAFSLVIWGSAVKNKAVSANKTYWKYGLAISLPLILHSVSLNILSQSDRIMITKFCGTDYTGIYSLAYSYAILINIVLGAVNEAWLPWFHDTFFEGNVAEIRKNVKPLIMLGGILGLGCIALAPEAMLILGPEDYQAGKWVVGPVTVGVICQFIYQQYVHIELHMKKTQYISLGTVIAAVLNIILNIIFIPKYGFIAAAYTTLACFFVLMLVHLTITRKILKVHLYDDWYMFAALGVIALLAVMFMKLYDTIILRYAVLVVVCLLYLFFNKSVVVKFLKKGGNKEKQV